MELNELESSYKSLINQGDDRHLLDLRKHIELIKSKIKEIKNSFILIDFISFLLKESDLQYLDSNVNF